MRKRDVQRWARRQYRGEVTPFPLWVVAVVFLIAIIIILVVIMNNGI